MAIPNHIETVRKWRAVYAGLSGPERAYQIVNGVAWDLGGEGCGLYAKENGPHGVSQDVVIFRPEGETFDILGDAEGQAKPQWSRTQPTGFGDLSRFRPATEPQIPGPGPGPEPPPPPPPPTGDHEARIQALERRCNDLETTLLEETAERMLLERKMGTLRAVGETSRAWGHGHSVDVPVVPR